MPSLASSSTGHPGHDLSEFYEGGLEKGGFSKLNLRKVRRPEAEGADEH